MVNDTCSIDGCEKPRKSRGWCEMHYYRWRRQGDPLTTLTPTRVQGSDKDRFYAKVSEPDTQGCKLWLGSAQDNGYGSFSIKHKSLLAHRVAYEYEIGPIPKGMTLDQTCHTRDQTCHGGICKHRLCVNVLHLEPVTSVDNTLRGKTLPALNAAKTHCLRWHEFTPENTYMNGNRRVCRTCARERRR